ncbi:hypothetical protein PINS_up019057 [Pythium insidiosum]|nr:hypothetical protein PINS_up019057 [Pythium insidiosum]
MELHLSEQLGNVAIREDDDTSEPWRAASSQRRVVSTTPVGLCVEANFVFFRELFPAGSSDDLPGEHALLAAQFVESDALYPYVPASRLRFDIVGNILISRAGDSGVVTFTRWASIRVHRGPSGAVPSELTTAIRDGLQQWADVMLRAIRERVELQTPNPGR